MLFLSNLSRREKIYLNELIQILEIKVSADTLNSLKPGVLQIALAARAANNLDRRKVRVINKILDKIVYPSLIDAEFTENFPKLEDLKETKEEKTNE